MAKSITSDGDHPHDIEANRRFGDPNEATPLLSTNNNGGSDDGDGTSSTRSIHLLPGMKLRAHAIDKQGRLSSMIKPKEALSGARKNKSRGGAFWIDIDADERDKDELKQWLQQLQLSPFLQTTLAEPAETWSSQVLTFDSAVLAVFRILPSQQASDDIAHMAALLMPNLLLTFTSCPRSDTGGLYAQALASMHARDGLPDNSSGGALCAWLQFHVERTSSAIRQLRFCTLQMDERMDQDIHSVKKLEVIEAKDQLLRLLSVAEEQLECVEALLAAGVEAGRGEPQQAVLLNFTRLRGTLGVLRATAAAMERMALRLETQLSDLRQRHDSHQQERINRRLAVLTVLSAVFLPLTLITGIWGMNFEYMPELKNPVAYPIALLLMLVIAATMICFFWRSGWFD